MNEGRLNAFEKMLSDILAQYDSVTEKLAVLKAEGKEKTVTYRQLFLQTSCNIKRYCRTTGHTVFWIMIRNNGGAKWHLKIN